MTYEETILRYRVVCHEHLPAEHREAMREQGIDPDAQWRIVWSFENEADAIECLKRERADAPHWQAWQLRDHGCNEVIERQAWL